MKKFLLVAAIAVCGMFSANAQGFKVGVNAGYTIGDEFFKEYYGLQVGLDVAYTWQVSENLNVGATTGYLRYFGEEKNISSGMLTLTIEAEDLGYIPVAGTLQYAFNESWFVGADLGYAIYVGEGNGDGGFYYVPKVGWMNESIELYVAYRGISIEGGSSSVIGLGVAYKF